jgi:glycolate oxidase FAD binding subunit
VRTVHEAVAALATEVGTDGPVVAVGGGTSGVAGDVAPAARAVRAPAGIVEWRPAEMTVRVLAGTTVAELDAVLAADGQCVAIPARPGSTVGGALALGRSGIRRLGWGPVRDTLLEATVVTAAGEVAVAGGPTVKNVSGFDLCRLLVGSLGTLAVIGEVVLRTRPLPPAERWLSGPADPADVARALHRPTALLWSPDRATWVLLSGHEVDVDAQAAVAADLGMAPADGPLLPPHRWSLPPAELRSTPGRGWVAEWGVGTVHHHEPQPPRPVDPAVRALHDRIKAAFDPTGRLAPGRSVLP